MRIATVLCFVSAVVLAGCSSSRGARVVRQPRATVADEWEAAPEVLGAPALPTHERVAAFAPLAAPDLPDEEALFVPAARSAKGERSACDPRTPSPSRPMQNLLRPPNCGPSG